MQEKQMHLVFEEDLKRLKRYFAGSGKDIEFINLWADNLRLGTYEENLSQEVSDVAPRDENLSVGFPKPEMWPHVCSRLDGHRVWSLKSTRTCPYGCGVSNPGNKKKSETSNKSLEWLQKLISTGLLEWNEKAECYTMTSPSNEVVWINRDGMVTDVEYR